MIPRPFVALMAPVLVIAILIFCGTGSRALAEELDIAQGTIYITETGYQQGTSQTASTGPYIISGTGSESIVIQSGTQDITISNLQITASGKPAIRVEAGATLKLTVVGENRLTAGSGFAGICVAPAYDSDWNYDTDASGKLYLFGDGTLNVEGGDGDAVGGTYGGGAGIGGNGEDQHGGDSVDFGLVCVTEGFTGILDASGGTASAYVDGENAFGGGAGIGSGGFNMGYINNYTDISPCYWGEVVGRIELHGGSIRAHAAGNGAGIGGGGGQGEDTASSQISILISGGSIIAEGGTLGAGIGGGAICDGGRIRISSGSISATAGPSEDSMGAAGIGGGNNSSVQEVSITGGTVIARASGGAAGIGGGTNTSYSPVHYGDVDGQVSPERSGSISISGAGTSVAAHGGTGRGYSGSYGGAGIGSDYPVANQDRSVAFKISITNGASVRAYGGYHSQAIGYGYRPTDYTGYGITLELDDSIFLWAQNVDYYQPALVAVTNYDDAPISYSSTSRYLTAYTDVDKNASAPASHQAPGYLGKPSAGVDETLDWKFDSMANNVRVGPVTVIDQVFGLNGNWATLCELKPVVISLADIIIYVGGAGYESVVTDLGGNVVNTVSDGLPEPGFIIELPLDVDQALKTAAGAPLDEPLDLSAYLSFAYSDAAGMTRTWSLERYDAKEGNSSMADGRYIYRIVPAKGQDPIRLAFTDEEGHRSNSDDFEIELEDLYQIYDMTIYAGALNADFFRAVITFPDKRIREMKVGVQSAKLTIRGVTLDEDPTTTIRTVAPTEPVNNFTAQVEPDTLFYINKSPLEVENYNAVKLLADEIVSEAQASLHQNALEAFSSRITQEYQVEFRYLDLVDTSNGNVWVTASNPVDIYWPYPEGTDQNTEFFIVHYYGLDRNDDDALPDGDYTMLLHAADERTLANTPYGIHIRVNEFSPFALFWKNENGPVNPVDPGDNVDISSQPPKTGDAAELALWIVLALGSLIGMLLLLFKVHGRRGW